MRPEQWQQFKRAAHEPPIGAILGGGRPLHDQGDLPALQVRIRDGSGAQRLERAAVDGLVQLGEFAGDDGGTPSAELC